MGEIVATRQHRDAGKPGAEHLGSTLGERRWRKICDRVKRIMPCLDRCASAAAGVREEPESVRLFALEGDCPFGDLLCTRKNGKHAKFKVPILDGGEKFFNMLSMLLSHSGASPPLRLSFL